jgi:hypothetical protein
MADEGFLARREDAGLEIVTGPQEPGKTFRSALGPLRMVIRVYVGDPKDTAVQEALDVLLDPDEDGSVVAILFADEDLGDVIKSLQVVGSSGWRTWQAKDSPPVMGAEITVEVTT